MAATSFVRRAAVVFVSASFGWLASGCTTVLTNDYEATAVTTYIWLVEYVTDQNKVNGTRIERFGSSSLVNTNGVMPELAVTGPDERGLWWPALPPQPTVDELEGNLRSSEEIGDLDLNKRVEYSLTYQADGETVTSPADYSVYRAAVKALRDDRPLELTLGVNDSTVEKADIR